MKKIIIVLAIFVIVLYGALAGYYTITKLNEPPTNISYLQSKINKGDSQAMYYMGNNYAHGSNGLEEDNQKALYWYQRAAELENPDALNLLGAWYLHGMNVKQDLEKALKYLKLSAEKGNKYGQMNLALMYMVRYYEAGYGYTSVNADYPKAVFWLQKAADQGVPEALTEFGQMYQHGTYFEQDFDKAEFYYKKAIEKGDHQAGLYLQYMQRNRYPHSDPVPR